MYSYIFIRGKIGDVAQIDDDNKLYKRTNMYGPWTYPERLKSSTLRNCSFYWYLVPNYEEV